MQDGPRGAPRPGDQRPGGHAAGQRPGSRTIGRGAALHGRYERCSCRHSERDGENEVPSPVPLLRGDGDRWAARFALTGSGVVGCSVRVTPQHAVLARRAELGPVATA
ncbi:hypothetical protein CIK81_06610 [Brachybacterium sp. JB7]|uniref:Uncharacterized protein n=1 Tax=Brachybacterium alimentarium TaxID=47845 RepID=A0A2A3YHL7_9MICO|nr:hypothetical protein CIK71_05605 [Brachybacterium alimentarium]RCS64988.1 hypothetical protein CIK81_06610 [Brachybacterium sp. JB7]PCC38777.1 hypothetical protein CIK66_12680 [Brachybacterium alimentarium]RCS68844.1 hypothetical protein CIK73_06500 [Brachybacterium alimentarium]RCS80361.1 hypothetical protein CIK70_03845 [Brachybacterium alimentarium]